MDLRDLRDAIRSQRGVVAAELEGVPPTQLRIAVDSESAGEWLVNGLFALLPDKFATVWIPGHRTIVLVSRAP